MFENEEILGGLQNGLRNLRRLEDDILSLNRCIRIASKESPPICLVFLDIKRACDNVDQNNLCSILREARLEMEGINLLKGS